MLMRPEIQITSMIKAMTDVVMPAVDPGNKLAVEQSQLIVGMLSVMAKQLPVQFHFDRDELQRLIDTAKTLQAVPTTDATVKSVLAQLAACSAAAVDVLEQCRHSPSTLEVSIRDMREAVGDVVQSLAATTDLAAQLQTEKIILQMSKEQLLRDRSLMLSQGWEPDPKAVPSIDMLLGLTGSET